MNPNQNEAAWGLTAIVRAIRDAEHEAALGAIEDADVARARYFLDGRVPVPQRFATCGMSRGTVRDLWANI